MEVPRGIRGAVLLRSVVFLVGLLLSHSATLAEKRMALLIGNETYAGEIGRLANPHNDVALLDQALKGLGFEVVVARDVGLGALTTAINAYARRMQAAGSGAVGIFYYSGHGASDGITNYLIPVDVKTIETGELWDQSLRLTEITRKFKSEAGNATHFVVFDACRNTLKLTQPGSRAIVLSKGFVPVAQENGMLIAYATAEGELASDVGSGAGPYAKALAEEIVKPGIEAVVMFRAVQRRVRAAIRQEPYLGFSTLGDVYLAGKDAKPSEPAVTQARLSEAAEVWDRTKDTSDIALLERFIARYKDTFYAEIAQARIEELKRKQTATVVPPTPPRTSERCDGIEFLIGEGERQCRSPGQAFKDCPECPEMVVVKAGEFMMGSPLSEADRSNDEGPQRKVTIAKPFAVGKFEVTFAEWDACIAAGGCKNRPLDRGWGRGRRPVINVSWHDAKEYVSWLLTKTRKTYRLLSEAEWEYAARAGTTTEFSTGRTITTEQANFNGDYTYGGSAKGVNRQKTIEVGSLNRPNAFGLHDMHGNAWEWVEDCYQNNYAGRPIDGSANSSTDCNSRVLRGGSALNIPQYTRSAYRGRDAPYSLIGLQGFRVARTLE
jgi:formylglycine-generating enzyme required for sulfatase activity